MRHLLICSFVILAGYEVLGQESNFSKRYEFYGGADVSRNVIAVDSGYYVVGGINTVSPQHLNILIMFLDKAGNMVWQKDYGEPFYNYYHGGPGSFIAIANEYYALAGGVVDTTGNNDAKLLLFDANGDTVWTRTYGDTNWQAGIQCKQTTDGGFILIGRTTTSDVNGDFWLIKTDSMGNMQWEQTYGGTEYEYGVSVDVCSDGGYILTGATDSYGPGTPTYSNIYIIKTDSQGNEEWNRIFGGPFGDCVWNVEQTSDGGYVIGGCYTANTIPDAQPYIVKLDSAGNTEWDNVYGPVVLGTGLKMVRELWDGNFIATGQTLDSLGGFVGLVLKVAPDGTEIWYRKHELLTANISTNLLEDIKPTDDCGFICSGWASPAIPDTGTQDIWILKLDSMGLLDSAVGNCPIVGVEEQLTISNEQITIYPNPTSSTFTIQGNYSLPEVLELYDITGRRVYQQHVTSSQQQVDVSFLSKGIYVWSIGEARGKVVIE